MLTGTGQYSSPAAQLTYDGTLVGAYEQIAKCCRRAWRTGSDPSEPTGSFVKILQRPGEDVTEFVDRLSSALRRQIPSPTEEDELLKQLAHENASEDCKAAFHLFVKVVALLILSECVKYGYTGSQTNHASSRNLCCL